MREYELSPGAERDLLEIAEYTLQTWGAEQLDRYETLLEVGISALAARRSLGRNPIPHRTDLRCGRVAHHIVFILDRGASVPLVLAVLHENMDLMARLDERTWGAGGSA